MPAFIPGLQLSELFYREAVEPILDRAHPNVPYAAALLGYGSEVLGFDTPRSTDHNWGPRLLLFLPDAEFERHRGDLDDTLRRDLPYEFRGYPTNFGPTEEEGTVRLAATASGPVNHRVEVATLARFLRDTLGIAAPPADIVDWLVLPEQNLLEVTAGRVFHDGPGDLTRARAALAYYPDDVWLYLLAAQWKRIAQHEAFVGRCGEVGDDPGSALVAATLVRDLMRLGFLMERTYAPYAKWLGTAFARLPCASRLLPPLAATLTAPSWQERERHLTAAYTITAEFHNALAITDPLPTDVRPFWGRPFLVIDAERFSHAIHARIIDPRVRALPQHVGAIDQIVDSPDLLNAPARRRRLRALYGDGAERSSPP